MIRFTPALLSLALMMAMMGPLVKAFVLVLPKIGNSHQHCFQELSLSLSLASDAGSELEMGMTPELKRVTDAFASIEQEQVRYKQLLYMAQTTEQVNNMPESSKIQENKVPGCLSTVFVDGEAVYDDEIGDYVINFQGDSDGLMTKGLVALLVRCLSGNTAEAIQKVDPQFIKIARIDQSLTPGRNNGFLNMLQTMKNKATSLDEAVRTSGASPVDGDDAGEDGAAAVVDGDEANGSSTNHAAILAALGALKPSSLTVTDNSPDGEADTRFVVEIVAPAFEGLNVIKRQQLIFMILADVMPEIQDLRIASMFTPKEAENQ